eukprot:4174884-Amphidinium_carterae.1
MADAAEAAPGSRSLEMQIWPFHYESGRKKRNKTFPTNILTTKRGKSLQDRVSRTVICGLPAMTRLQSRPKNLQLQLCSVWPCTECAYAQVPAADARVTRKPRQQDI